MIFNYYKQNMKKGEYALRYDTNYKMYYILLNNKYEYWEDGLWIALNNKRDIPQYCFKLEKKFKKEIEKIKDLKNFIEKL